MITTKRAEYSPYFRLSYASTYEMSIAGATNSSGSVDEPNWIDRLGRLVGGVWVVLMVAWWLLGLVQTVLTRPQMTGPTWSGIRWAKYDACPFQSSGTGLIFMRELTTDQRALFERRRSQLDAFFEESRPVLVDFMTRLELPEPHLVLKDAVRYLPAVDQWMSAQVVTPEDQNWIGTRIGYFIGEVLNQHLGGHWFVEDDPQSPNFGQYVVGRFTQVPNPSATASPFALAMYYVSQTPSRSLSDLIARVEKELRGS
jgi:hypothetical protein